MGFVTNQKKWIKRFKLSLKQLRCEHWWRPGRTLKGLVRYCEDCEYTEVLTEPEYYAQFGRFAKARLDERN